MSSFNSPAPNKTLTSIEEGADRIAALFADETTKMQAFFSGVISGMQQQLAREQYEKEYWWRRVRELEAELHSLRSLGMDQRKGGVEER